MISNSIANRALRTRIQKAFEDGGYALDERNPDFAVAFYATAREKLDATLWDYGYPFTPGWPPYPRQVQTITQYTEGSVIIDVVKPGTGSFCGGAKAKRSCPMIRAKTSTNSPRRPRPSLPNSRARRVGSWRFNRNSFGVSSFTPISKY
jgi:hypothetical protein